MDNKFQAFFESIKSKPYWLSIIQTIDTLYKTTKVFPGYDNIFKCFEYFKPEQTKVVILGQDPYPAPGDANGLAFSVNRNHDLPHSLINIYKELKNDLNINRNNGDLYDWAQQGVLLLNTALTFAPNHPELMKLWEPFIIDVIKWIDEHNWNVVFILWGKQAQRFIPHINNNKEHVIFSGHPSFASVHKQFFNTNPFSKTNAILAKLKQSQIKW